MERIAKLMDRLLEEADGLASGSNVNVRDMGLVVDMIKDLAEAEESCAKTCYYESVVEDMEGEGWEDRYGYDGGYTGNDVVRNAKRASRQTEPRMGYRDSKGRYSTKANRARRGYSDESIENVRMMMQQADPERREQLKRDLESMIDEM